jgi:uncharacterized protein YidB (DUF937 family)
MLSSALCTTIRSQCQPRNPVCIVLLASCNPLPEGPFFLHEGAISMSLLGNVLGRRRGGVSPITLGLLGLLAYRTFQGKGRLAEMIGHNPGKSGSTNANDGASESGGNIGDWLRNVLGGGAAGSLLSGGLGDLVRSFQQRGQGDKANSWVAKGANAPIAPPDLEQVLGEDRIAWLMRETGMPREELLAGLSKELPDAVDQLTPEGRLPTEQEASRMV